VPVAGGQHEARVYSKKRIKKKEKKKEKANLQD
jgi:hypothetical protein